MKFYIDEEILVINNSPVVMYKVHGEHCATQYYTSFYEAERHIRILSGFYGVNENRKTYNRWTYDSKGHEIRE